MSKRSLSAAGSILVVVVVALVTAWTQSGSDDDARAGGTPSSAVSSSARAGSGLPTIAVGALPTEARHTLALIDAGGPYPYPDHDDATFGNYEGILPKEPRGYYREYTVETPGSDDRGARRIIRGEGGELYYTDDHYASFSRIER